jgi:hypothetical protein
MSRTLRLAGIQLALAAMMLRALLPDGWMPSASGAPGIPIAICTANGPVQLVIGQDGRTDKQNPAHDDARHQDVCPFAAAPHFATGATGIFHALPLAEAQFAAPAFASGIAEGMRQHTPQSPRAPPVFV